LLIAQFFIILQVSISFNFFIFNLFLLRRPLLIKLILKLIIILITPIIQVINGQKYFPQIKIFLTKILITLLHLRLHLILLLNLILHLPRPILNLIIDRQYLLIILLLFCQSLTLQNLVIVLHCFTLTDTVII